MTNVRWRKASRSDDRGGACIELANVPHTVAVRDSKDPEGPKLVVARADFRRFATAVRGI
nr:DUF397 domain-containing protein [Actinomadura rayongensis]